MTTLVWRGDYRYYRFVLNDQYFNEQLANGETTLLEIPLTVASHNDQIDDVLKISI